jgi:hypothetical protein
LGLQANNQLLLFHYEQAGVRRACRDRRTGSGRGRMASFRQDGKVIDELLKLAFPAP